MLEIFMELTNPKKLRAELKDYLDLAEKEPVRIQRRSGSTFVLMNEDKYAEMQSEIMSLQRRLLSMSQVLDSEAEDMPSKEDRLKRFEA